MLKKAVIQIMPVLAVVMLTVTLATPVLAQGGGHLWFYSQDPPWPMQNPENWDPKYVESNPDPWLSESIVIPSGDWETPFTIWLACAKFESINTKLVISINDAASNAIEEIKVNGTVIGDWHSGSHPYLSQHGVFNSPEFHGYAEVNVGDLYNNSTHYKVAIEIEIELKEDADLTNAKVHFDAYGFTMEGRLIFSPYSHDLNFVIPELATVLIASASLTAFGIYAYRRKR
jgi:hypothetical protein